MTATQRAEIARPVDPFATIPGAHADINYLAPAAAVQAPTKTVRDNVAYAWRNSAQECLYDLPCEFTGDYRALLDEAATAAMETVLPEVWREHGYLMLGCTETEMGDVTVDRGVDDFWFHLVWDTASKRIDAAALVEAAGLTDELAAFNDRDY